MTKKRLEQAAQASFWIGVALFLWIWIWPEPYALAIAVALVLPWVAAGLIVRFPGVFSLGLRVGPGRGSLSGLFLLPSFVLAMRALMDFTFLDVWRLVIFALVLATMLLLILTRVLPKSAEHWSEWVVLAFAVLAYSYGTLVQLDTFPDHEQAQTYRATVVKKYISHGKSWSYHLDLEPWGPDDSVSSPRVSAELYARVKPGMQVCATMHPGFIGLRWYETGLC